jgi:hypothetical protein
MFERGAAPIPMFGWWCNLPDCLCGDSRLGCPSSQSRSLVLVARAKYHHRCLVYRPRIRRYRFVSKATASLRIRRFASFHISACFLSYQASASVSSSSHRFVSKIIAPLRKPSLYQASLGLKSPLGPSPVLFPLPRVTSNLALAIQISNHDRGQDGPLPSKPPRQKPFVSKSLIPKSFDRGRLRRTFRYNDDSKDVEKRGEGGTPAIHPSNRPHPPRASRRFPYLFWPEINSPHLPESRSPKANNFPQEIRVPDGWDGVRCSRSSFIPA